MSQEFDVYVELFNIKEHEYRELRRETIRRQFMNEQEKTDRRLGFHVLKTPTHSLYIERVQLLIEYEAMIKKVEVLTSSIAKSKRKFLDKEMKFLVEIYSIFDASSQRDLKKQLTPAELAWVKPWFDSLVDEKENVVRNGRN